MAHNVTLKNTALQDQAVTWQDVEIDTTTVAYKLRREIESKMVNWCALLKHKGGNRIL